MVNQTQTSRQLSRYLNVDRARNLHFDGDSDDEGVTQPEPIKQETKEGAVSPGPGVQVKSEPGAPAIVKSERFDNLWAGWNAVCAASSGVRGSIHWSGFAKIYCFLWVLSIFWCWDNIKQDAIEPRFRSLKTLESWFNTTCLDDMKTTKTYADMSCHEVYGFIASGEVHTRPEFTLVAKHAIAGFPKGIVLAIIEILTIIVNAFCALWTTLQTAYHAAEIKVGFTGWLMRNAEPYAGIISGALMPVVLGSVPKAASLAFWLGKRVFGY